ncbi:hypothetical protein FPV67DRAFT_616072 [Lyophyllum atratum]|nr:hypothetical protein FPV67DRAFT_616072 [Lyophyllum atratum]
MYISDDEIESPAFDDVLYGFEGTDLAFYQEQTGIMDEAELKSHIMSVAGKAYEVYEYPFIRRFTFLRLRISRLSIYSQVLELGRQRPNAVFLDIACGFGNILRKVVADGWPAKNTLGSDIRPGFWDHGHELFKSSPESFSAGFVAGDVFDSAHIAPREPFYNSNELETPVPDLQLLTSLTPMQGRISAIHASYFFHIFDEAQQLEVARRLATLLSPDPGSVIFGMHISQPGEKGLSTEVRSVSGWSMFCHSLESWRTLWDGEVFTKGMVRVECGLQRVKRDASVAAPDAEFHEMWWCVTRL